MTALSHGGSPVRELLIVALDDDRVAFSVADIREVQRAAMPTPLPNGPDIVDGVLNVRGELMPVLNIRRRLGRPDRQLRASDHLVVARASGRLTAFAVDAVIELARIPESHIAAASSIAAGTAHIAGVATLPDGVLVVHDLAALLGAGELFALDAALDAAGSA